MSGESNKGFEKLISWQKSRTLNKQVYDITNRGAFHNDYALRDQVRKACISISSNIAEGFGRGGSGEFIYFLNVAQASCYEVKSQLYLALDINYINDAQFQELYDLCDEVSKTIYGLIKHLKNTDN
jgi:four helix bundle protein